jgi:pimeloyl-ACP methyl ester carboxylesterase
MSTTSRKIRVIDLPDGTRLPCAEHGDAGGLPVLFLHGVTDSLRSWEPLLPYLPTTMRALTLTQRGHAGASQPAKGYRIADLAADAVAALDALDIEHAVLVGHSMGSVVAQRVALDHPQRVRGLALLGSFTSMARNAEVQGLAAEVDALRDPIDVEFVREFQASTLAQPVADAFFAQVVGDSLAVPARIWCALFDGFCREDIGSELGRFAAPTLIIAGGRDAICPLDDQRTLADRIPHAALHVLPEAGHAMHWEDPVGVAGALGSFFSYLVDRPALVPPQRGAVSTALK